MKNDSETIILGKTTLNINGVNFPFIRQFLELLEEHKEGKYSIYDSNLDIVEVEISLVKEDNSILIKYKQFGEEKKTKVSIEDIEDFFKKFHNLQFKSECNNKEVNILFHQEGNEVVVDAICNAERATRKVLPEKFIENYYINTSFIYSEDDNSLIIRGSYYLNWDDNHDNTPYEVMLEFIYPGDRYSVEAFNLLYERFLEAKENLKKIQKNIKRKKYRWEDGIERTLKIGEIEVTYYRVIDKDGRRCIKVDYISVPDKIKWFTIEDEKKNTICKDYDPDNESFEVDIFLKGKYYFIDTDTSPAKMFEDRIRKFNSAYKKLKKIKKL